MARDFKPLDDAVAALKDDVVKQDGLQQAHDDAEANLATETANANQKIQDATKQLAAANDAMQAGSASVDSDVQALSTVVAGLKGQQAVAQ